MYGKKTVYIQPIFIFYTTYFLNKMIMLQQLYNWPMSKETFVQGVFLQWDSPSRPLFMEAFANKKFANIFDQQSEFLP